MGGIAGLIGLDVKKWNLVAEKLGVTSDELNNIVIPKVQQLVIDTQNLVAKFTELADIILDKEDK